MSDDRQFTIGKLSRLAGVGIETIRYYERIRLLPVRRAAGTAAAASVPTA